MTDSPVEGAVGRSPVVAAAGDDISLPYRTERLYEVWSNSDRKSFSIHSAAHMIDDSRDYRRRKSSPDYCDSSNKTKTQCLFEIVEQKKQIFGPTHAWGPDCSKKFSPLEPGITSEDRVIPFARKWKSQSLVER